MARSASRALGVPILNDRNTMKSAETTAKERLLHFMAQLPLGRKRRRVWNDGRRLSLKYNLSARAVSGHAAAAPPSSVMNSRRLMCTPVVAQNLRDGSWTGCKQEQAVLGGSTLVAMMQTANFREGNDNAGRRRLYGTGPRAVLAERKMRSAVTMVLKIAR